MPDHPTTYHPMTEASMAIATKSQAWSQLPSAGYRSAAIVGESPTIFVVDDDAAIRETIRDLLEDHGYAVECYADGPAFLRAYRGDRNGCLLIDALMPEMSGIALLGQLESSGIDLPTIMMSGDLPLYMAVQAMKAGAVDIIEKPFKSERLLATIRATLERAHFVVTQPDFRKSAARRIGSLTKRQREILDLVVAGHPTKNIAADLHISQRTVDNHRAAIARKTCSKSLPALIQTAICAKCSIHAQSQRQLVQASSYKPAGEGDVLH